MPTNRQVSKSTERNFGDFQTPPSLARNAIARLQGISPRSIIEPTCGTGAFLSAAMKAFPGASSLIGADINKDHLSAARRRLAVDGGRAVLIRGDFFQLDWERLIANLPRPILVIGNPPWVTNSELGTIGGDNLPGKSNDLNLRGLDALTGKSNFDISEWMILKYLDWIAGSEGATGVLCKTAVARKVLRQARDRAIPISSASMYLIDARAEFGVSVDACFLTIEVRPGAAAFECRVFPSLDAERHSRTIGFIDGFVIPDTEAYEKMRILNGRDENYPWRSGIKHDCSAVMELEMCDAILKNGLGENIEIEETFLYPLLKSSDLTGGRARRKYLIVTQRRIGEETASIGRIAPLTWRYLESHRERLDARRSSIYRGRPRYSIFGVGDYSFAGWKVAISALGKKLDFRAVSPYRKKTVVFDDTVNFLPCESAAEARFIAEILNSEPAREFLESMIFWSDKRPLTIELLRRLDLEALSAELGRSREYRHYAARRRAEYRAVK